MGKVEDLIERARELAKLAEEATPGPYTTEVWLSGRLIHRAGIAYCNDQRCGCLEAGFVAKAVSPQDARLLAASWDMARLLAEMADELERLSPEKKNG